MRKIRIFLGTPGVVSLLFKYACLVLSDELVNFITCRKDKIVDRCGLGPSAAFTLVEIQVYK